MIYLQNITDSQSVFVPRSIGDIPDGDMVFKARNTIDLSEEINVRVIDLQMSDLYFFLAVTLDEGVPSGEYEYSLQADGIQVASGLMVIGESDKPREYNNAIRYEQYTTE